MGRIRNVAGFHRPGDMDEALGLLTEYGETARIIAGGTDVLSLPQEADSDGFHLIDIAGLGLDCIVKQDDGVHIGAAATINAVAESEHLGGSLIGLVEAARAHSTHTLRNRATIGGNLTTGSPFADLPPALLALDASLMLTGPDEERTIPIEEFFLGPNWTALGPGEILREIIVPKPKPNSGSSFLKLTRHQTEIDPALVNAATLVTLKNGAFAQIRIGLGGVGPVPFRAGAAERLFLGKSPDKNLILEAAQKAARESAPLSDNRASAEYRRQMVAVLVEDSLNESLERSRG